jgi:hypothetical protein
MPDKDRLNMDQNKSVYAEVLDPDFEVKRLYNLLEHAKQVFARSLKAKKGGVVPADKIDQYCKMLLDKFAADCQWATDYVRQEYHNAPISAELKYHYHSAWSDFIGHIYDWLKYAFDNTKADFIEYEKLKSKRDDLFEQGAILFKAANDKLESKIQILERGHNAPSSGAEGGGSSAVALAKKSKCGRPKHPKQLVEAVIASKNSGKSWKEISAELGLEGRAAEGIFYRYTKSHENTIRKKKNSKP